MRKYICQKCGAPTDNYQSFEMPEDWDGEEEE